MNTVFWGLLGIGCSLPALGCGRPAGVERASLEGKVEFDGSPVENGSLTLVPMDTAIGLSAGSLIKDGSYHIPAAKGPVPGEYKVEILGLRSTGSMVSSEGVVSEEVEAVEQFLPARYNRHSELRIEIQSGQNFEDFSLEP